MEGVPSMRGWMMEGRAHEVRRRPSLAPPTAGAGAVSSAPALAAHRGVQARKQPPLVCAGAGSDCWCPRPGRTTSTTRHSLRAAAGGAAGGLGASPSSATNEVGTRCRSRCCPGGRLPPSGHLMDGLPLPPGCPLILPLTAPGVLCLDAEINSSVPIHSSTASALGTPSLVRLHRRHSPSRCRSSRNRLALVKTRDQV